MYVKIFYNYSKLQVFILQHALKKNKLIKVTQNLHNLSVPMYIYTYVNQFSYSRDSTLLILLILYAYLNKNLHYSNCKI